MRATRGHCPSNCRNRKHQIQRPQRAASNLDRIKNFTPSFSHVLNTVLHDDDWSNCKKMSAGARAPLARAKTNKNVVRPVDRRGLEAASKKETSQAKPLSGVAPAYEENVGDRHGALLHTMTERRSGPSRLSGPFRIHRYATVIYRRVKEKCALLFWYALQALLSTMRSR